MCLLTNGKYCASAIISSVLFKIFLNNKLSRGNSLPHIDLIVLTHPNAACLIGCASCNITTIKVSKTTRNYSENLCTLQTEEQSTALYFAQKFAAKHKVTYK